METVTIVLILLLAVIVSGTISRIVPLPFPRPLFQIALGAVIGLTGEWRVMLDPDLFFLLFLPPLLFIDGWRIPREELFRDGKTVLELALGLVVFTVLGVGFLIHWLIPAMPLAVCFALAAVVSPTDPIAVSAIAQRVPIPKRMMHILEGESLLNDASGLVCLRFAIAAALTGAFSIKAAALSFLWMSLGGLASGVLVAWGISRIKSWITKRYGNDDGAQVLVSVLIPFAAYLLAEHLHCSGILAAVAAGLTMGFVEVPGEIEANTRLRRTGLWDMLQFTLNGIIFVLLGEQLPVVFEGARQIVQVTGHLHVGWLAVYVLAINVGLALLRFVWVWVSLRLTFFRAGERHRSPNWRIVAAMSVAGVRGAITLAGVLTLPLAMPDGSAFPARSLAILLAMGVIIFSLVVASVALPWLLNGLTLPPEPSHAAEEDAARVAAAQAAIAAVELAEHTMAHGKDDADMYVTVAARIMDAYRQRIDSRSLEGEERLSLGLREQVERHLRLAGLRAERRAISDMARRQEIGTEITRKLLREIDLMEARILA
ncbi:Na+/H+ antiporter [Novosphingobium sp. 9]|uniref:Na+/H+ antiporter n=1 Tax=Novosphingobium sp. 9 TaxID=2025349 RepID=UPI0021B61908|nr:Na+/H+ antiporter [Novosphingobium sp. 9]